jgi:predicted Na+-dependent transporter
MPGKTEDNEGRTQVHSNHCIAVIVITIIISSNCSSNSSSSSSSSSCCCFVVVVVLLLLRYRALSVNAQLSECPMHFWPRR